MGLINIQDRHPSEFNPRSDRALLREITKHPITTPQNLQASNNMLNVNIHGSTGQVWHVWKGCQEKASSL